MPRVCLILLAVSAVLSASPGHAQNQPRIAILGIEVVGGKTLNERSTKAAQRITDELRYQATRPISPFALAPNSAKDFLELKILSNCTDENLTCIAQIGRDLRADWLVYGKLEKRNKKYVVNLTMVDTGTARVEGKANEFLTISDIKPRGLWGARLYAKLVGADLAAKVILSTNATKGTVYVDDAVVTKLRDGRATITGLDAGVHSVAIEAPGFARYEADVAVDPGATERLAVSLVAVATEDRQKRSSNGWRYAFLGGFAVTAGLTGGWLYNGLRVRGQLADDKDDAFQAIEAADAVCAADPSACGEVYTVGRIAENSDNVLVHIVDPITGQSSGTRPASLVPNDECGPPGNHRFGSPNCRVASIDDSCGAAKRYRDTLAQASSSELDAYIDACDAGQRAALMSNIFMGASITSAVLTAYFAYKGWFDDDKRERGDTALRVSPGLDGLGVGLAIDF